MLPKVSSPVLLHTLLSPALDLSMLSLMWDLVENFRGSLWGTLRGVLARLLLREGGDSMVECGLSLEMD